jgi:hypothetical protein
MSKKSILTNMRDEPFDQLIDGVHYVIPPHGSITLERYLAVNVRGHYTKEPVNLKIEHIKDPSDDVKNKSGRVYVAPDGKEFSSAAEVQEYCKSKKG